MKNLTPRTIIILAIFAAVLITVNTFIFAYGEQTDALIQKYIAKITICGNITDEGVCFDKSFCKGIYGPSCPGCEDIVFLECKKITSSDKVNTASRKSMCAETGGLWQIGIRGDYCTCSPDKTFNPSQGCIPR